MCFRRLGRCSPSERRSFTRRCVDDYPDGYFQRVERTKPTMISPKPMAMFHSPIEPIGYSVWVT